MDSHKNFAISSIVTAPSPATSGTSLVVTTGDGALFAAPCNATIWPAGVNATAANSEIVRITAISTNTFTITRTQESTTARTILVGDQIAATITAKTLTDIESPRIQSVTSAATVTPNADTNDAVKITAQAVALTIANPTGTPVDMQAMVIMVKDNNTAQTIAMGTQYRAVGVTIPTITVAGKTLYLGIIWNATATKWDVIGLSQE